MQKVSGRLVSKPSVIARVDFLDSIQSTRSTYAEISANGALALLAVACSLLDRQIATLEKNFVEEGGFTERLYRVRSQRRTGG